MADKKEVELLPIDVDIPMPEIIPLKCEVVKKFLAEHEHGLRLLETWARLHLEALTVHPKTPTKFVDNLIDEIGDEAIYETKDKVFQKFDRAHVNDKMEKPIGFEMADEDLAGFEVEGEGIDGMRLLEPDCKKKRGSLFKRLLKWVPRRKTKEQEGKDPRVVEDEWQRERLLSYEELKVRFAQFLDEEVYRHKSTRASRRAARGEDVANPENLETEEGRWISDMTHRLHVCHMAFKLLGIVREKCEDVFKILAFSDVGPDVSFKGEHSNLMQGRLAYLQTTKTLALIMVHDIERMQVDNEIYAECVERFGKVYHRGREPLSRKDSVETKVITQMILKESILPCAGSGTPEKIAANMLKSESQRDLVLDTDDDPSFEPHHKLFNESSGSSADLTSPGVASNFPVTTPTGMLLVFQANVVQNDQAQTTNQFLYIDPAVNSTSGYNSGWSLVSQSPADTLQDSSLNVERPSSLHLPDSLTDRSKQEPKEGSTSPMQTSPTENIPSIDNLKEDMDEKLKATEGKGSTSPMQTSLEKIPSTDNLKEDINERFKAIKGKGSTSPMQTSPPEKIPSDGDLTDNSDGDSTDNLEGDSNEDSTDKSEDIEKLKEGKLIGKGKGKGKRKRKGKLSKIPVETSHPEKKPSEEDSTDKLNEDIEKKLKDL